MSRFLDAKYGDIQPYTPGEQPRAERLVKLNTNELPYPPPPAVAQAARAEATRLNRYPDPTAGAFLAALANALGVKPGNVIAGNGSDELLAFCFQALCPQGTAFADLTYGFYPVYCRLYGVDVKIIPLRADYTLAPEDYYSLGRTLFIANPNAPTGIALGRGQIEGILQNNPNSLVVIDEAYVDFGAESAVPLLDKYDNLLVVGTFSKSRAMAGARLGYAAGSIALIADLNRIKYSFNPYNLNRMTLAAGVAALEEAAYFEDCRKKIAATRTRLLAALAQRGFESTGSLANFVFTTHPAHSGESLYKALREKGVLVRWFAGVRTQNHLRISIGTEEETDALLAALDGILG